MDNRINPQIGKTQEIKGKEPVKQNDAVAADKVKLANIQNLFAKVVQGAPKEFQVARAVLEAA